LFASSPCLSLPVPAGHSRGNASSLRPRSSLQHGAGLIREHEFPGLSCRPLDNSYHEGAGLSRHFLWAGEQASITSLYEGTFCKSLVFWHSEVPMPGDHPYLAAIASVSTTVASGRPSKNGARTTCSCRTNSFGINRRQVWRNRPCPAPLEVDGGV